MTWGPFESAPQNAAPWDRYPGLIFKGFLVQEMGRSSTKAYSSLYLWRDAEAFTAMVAGERLALSARFVRRAGSATGRL